MTAKEDVIPLDGSILLTDSLVFGLRMNSGVNLNELSLRYPNSEGVQQYDALFLQLEHEGLIRRGGQQIRLTDAGRLLADGIGSRILELAV